MKSEKNPAKIFADKTAAVSFVADEIENLIRAKNAKNQPAVLGLATGATPVALYAELARRHRQNNLSFRNVITFNLDEYCGLTCEDEVSYRYFMNSNLFSKIDIDIAKTFVLDGMKNSIFDAEKECARYENLIAENGGIDLQILGIGRTGHIGFNEPPASFGTRTRRVSLDEQTRRDNAIFFGDLAQVPFHALSMGIGTIFESRKILLLAFGKSKSEIIKRALTEKPNENCPASWLQNHADCAFVLDREAACLLG